MKAKDMKTVINLLQTHDSQLNKWCTATVQQFNCLVAIDEFHKGFSIRSQLNFSKNSRVSLLTKTIDSQSCPIFALPLSELVWCWIGRGTTNKQCPERKGSLDKQKCLM